MTPTQLDKPITDRAPDALPTNEAERFHYYRIDGGPWRRLF